MTARRATELTALGVGAAVWGYVGWDGALWDARFQAVLHLFALAAVAGVAALAVRGARLPRTRLDVPILVLLLAFGVATLSAWNLGLSAAALAAILGTTAMLPVALLAVRHRPAWTALVVILPVLVLAAGTLAVIAWRRVEWILAGGPGLPPVRLGHEGTPFGSVAVPAFVLLGALPLALLIEDRAWRRRIVVALLVIGIPTTLVSGSRSAWIAAAVALAVLVAPWLRRRLEMPIRRRRWTARDATLAVVGLGAIVLALLFVSPRLTEAESLTYRAYLWRDTLTAWSADPLLGVGPGGMPFLRQVAAPDLTFPVRQPHSHDVLLGVLGDAGIVGALAAVALFVAFVVVAGPWRTRSVHGRAAFAVLMGFAAASAFEDLTFLPGFNLLVLLLAAVALTDAGAVTWHRIRSPREAASPTSRVASRLALASGVVAGLALVAIMLLGDTAAIAYRIGTDRAWELNWGEATAWFQRAERLDPWHPSTPKSLAVTAERAGQPRLAAEASRRAVAMNAGDGPAWANLAILCLQGGDPACARHAADQAVARAAQGRELINAALVYDALGDRQAADAAYRLSALTNYWTTLTYAWPRPMSVGSQDVAELGDAVELNRVIARRVLGEPIRPDDYAGPYARALAFAMVGRRADAAGEIQRAIAGARGSAATWELAAVLERAAGGDSARDVRIAELVRQQSMGEQPPEQARLTFDIATFRAYPADELIGSAEHLVPLVAWPWILQPLLSPPAAGGG
ncbi:MAG TPA: O-antigen ligase family protein [Candidatus Limnocylindria bacterium]